MFISVSIVLAVQQPRLGCQVHLNKGVSSSQLWDLTIRWCLALRRWRQGRLLCCLASLCYTTETAAGGQRARRTFCARLPSSRRQSGPGEVNSHCVYSPAWLWAGRDQRCTIISLTVFLFNLKPFCFSKVKSKTTLSRMTAVWRPTALRFMVHLGYVRAWT